MLITAHVVMEHFQMLETVTDTSLLFTHLTDHFHVYLVNEALHGKTTFNDINARANAKPQGKLNR
jgi:hypothetical protein